MCYIIEILKGLSFVEYELAHEYHVIIFICFIYIYIYIYILYIYIYYFFHLFNNKLK
jgi:hypothetical protein